MGKVFKAIAFIGLALFLGPGAFGLTGLGILTGAQALMFGISAVGSFLMKDKMDQAGAKRDDPGFMVNKQSTQQPLYVVYGERRIGPHRVYIETSDDAGSLDGTQYLHMAMAIGEGEIEDIKCMRFNDKLIWVNTNSDIQAEYATEISDKSISTNAKGMVTANDEETSQDFSTVIKMAYWKGSDDQYFESPDFNTQSDMAWATDEFYKGGTNGDSDRRGRGVVWMYIRFKYDRELVPNVPTIITEVRGRPVANVADSSESWSGLTYAQKTARMTNPANCIADYIENTRYGKGLTANTLDKGSATTSFGKYRQWCIDNDVTFNGAVNTDNTLFSNMQGMLSSGNCYLTFTNGVYKIRPNRSETFDSNTHIFTKDNIISDVHIEMGSKQSKSNIMKGSYFDRDKFNQSNTSIQPPITTTNTYLAEDNDTLNESSFQIDFCDNETLADKLTKFQLDLSRYATVMQFKTTWGASNLEVGDPVYVTYDRYGFTNKKFRLVGQTMNADGTIDVSLLEYPTDESIFLEVA